jgi:hypothetical protein
MTLKAPTVRTKNMSAKLQYALLHTACFVALSSNNVQCTAGRAALTVNSLSSSQKEESHCSSYIAAYGVSIAEYQRIEKNWKAFPSICPAPSPASVDFVVIFTHDSDYYRDSLPGPVHTDSSGFSDWSAVVTLDNTRPPEKYNREYVWVFRFKRGSFAPGHFATTAKPDHSEVESGAHNSDRAVDAAFKFIAGQKA